MADKKGTSDKRQETSRKAVPKIVKSTVAKKDSGGSGSGRIARMTADAASRLSGPAGSKSNMGGAPTRGTRDTRQSRGTSLSVPVYSLAGREAGSLSLPKEVFGVKVNQALLSQALRVYMNNAKGHFSHTKSRGQVEGSSRKIYRQKGTGRARHGSIRANIFVGGGVALGPKSRNVVLELPQKMRKAALISALSSKNEDKAVLGVSGLEKASGKTKEFANLLAKLNESKSQMSQRVSSLIVMDKKNENVQRAVRNLERVDFTAADQLNAYEVVAHQSLVLTKEAVARLKERVGKVSRVSQVSRGETKNA